MGPASTAVPSASATAWVSSWAVWKRSSGCLAMALATTGLSVSGSMGQFSVTAGTGLSICFITMPTVLSASYGTRPVSIW